MALRAYLAEDITAQGVQGSRIMVWYYDDADPENVGVGPGPPPVPPRNVLHSKMFVLPTGRPIGDLLPVIDREGQEARAALTHAATLRGSLPIGSTRLIP